MKMINEDVDQVFKWFQTIEHGSIRVTVYCNVAGGDGFPKVPKFLKDESPQDPLRHHPHECGSYLI